MIVKETQSEGQREREVKKQGRGEEGGNETE